MSVYKITLIISNSKLPDFSIRFINSIKRHVEISLCFLNLCTNKSNQKKVKNNGNLRAKIDLFKLKYELKEIDLNLGVEELVQTLDEICNKNSDITIDFSNLFLYYQNILYQKIEIYRFLVDDKIILDLRSYLINRLLENNHIFKCSFVKMIDDKRYVVLRDGFFSMDYHFFDKYVAGFYKEIFKWIFYPNLKFIIKKYSKKDLCKYNNSNILFNNIFYNIKTIVLKLYMLFIPYDVWNIGSIECSIENIMKLNKIEINWMKHDSDGFKADPFGLCGGDNEYIFYEYFDYGSKLGEIRRYNVKNKRIDVMLNKKYHVSYPYIFRNDKVFYCLPETSSLNKLLLYPFDGDGNFSSPITLIDGIKALDPSIVYYKKYWWIFFTKLDDLPIHNLYIYYSKNMLGPYTSHILNPVKTDPRSSRSAGTIFKIDGILYRPTQNCESTYGGKIEINKIIDLTTDSFKEESVYDIKPDYRNGYYGVHTISSFGDRTLIDMKKKEINMHWIKNKLKYFYDKILRFKLFR